MPSFPSTASIFRVLTPPYHHFLNHTDPRLFPSLAVFDKTWHGIAFPLLGHLQREVCPVACLSAGPGSRCGTSNGHRCTLTAPPRPGRSPPPPSHLPDYDPTKPPPGSIKVTMNRKDYPADKAIQIPFYPVK